MAGSTGTFLCHASSILESLLRSCQKTLDPKRGGWEPGRVDKNDSGSGVRNWAGERGAPGSLGRARVLRPPLYMGEGRGRDRTRPGPSVGERAGPGEPRPISRRPPEEAGGALHNPSSSCPPWTRGGSGVPWSHSPEFQVEKLTLSGRSLPLGHVERWWHPPQVSQGGLSHAKPLALPSCRLWSVLP